MYNHPANHLHHYSAADNVHPVLSRIEWFHEIRVDQVDPEEKEKRKRADDVAREPRLRRLDANLSLNAEAFADRVTDVLQDLGEVAADFALNEHGGDAELEVENRHALD